MHFENATPDDVRQQKRFNHIGNDKWHGLTQVYLFELYDSTAKHTFR